PLVPYQRGRWAWLLAAVAGAVILYLGVGERRRWRWKRRAAAGKADPRFEPVRLGLVSAVLLMMFLASSLLWSRSYMRVDEIAFGGAKTWHSVASYRGGLLYTRCDDWPSPRKEDPNEPSGLPDLHGL